MWKCSVWLHLHQINSIPNAQIMPVYTFLKTFQVNHFNNIMFDSITSLDETLTHKIQYICIFLISMRCIEKFSLTNFKQKIKQTYKYVILILKSKTKMPFSRKKKYYNIIPTTALPWQSQNITHVLMLHLHEIQHSLFYLQKRPPIVIYWRICPTKRRGVITFRIPPSL